MERCEAGGTPSACAVSLGSLAACALGVCCVSCKAHACEYGEAREGGTAQCCHERLREGRQHRIQRCRYDGEWNEDRVPDPPRRWRADNVPNGCRPAMVSTSTAAANVIATAKRSPPPRLCAPCNVSTPNADGGEDEQRERHGRPKNPAAMSRARACRPCRPWASGRLGRHPQRGYLAEAMERSPADWSTPDLAAGSNPHPEEPHLPKRPSSGNSHALIRRTPPRRGWRTAS